MNEELRRKILTLLDQHRIMTIATLRTDGWPQATTVGFANDGLTLYFLCGPESQKASNLARDDRVSLTIDHDTPQVMEITGCRWLHVRNLWSIKPKRKKPCACSCSAIPSNQACRCPCQRRPMCRYSG